MNRRRLTCILLSLLLVSLTTPSNAQAIVPPAGLPLAPTTTSGLRARVIVFVHGLHGNRDSWRAANNAYWPDMLKTDPRFAFSDVVVAEYPSPVSRGKMSSVQLADILYNRLQQDRVWDHREVVFLAHSLGGILVEEMLLRHPAQAQQVRFVVSYGTPHTGSTVARLASLYDKDPLLNDLSDAQSNSFLTQLEDHWRATPAVNQIHRFCAYESEDTTADDGIARYLKAHTRVVGYISATYGCDVTTPPQQIPADHIRMIKPADRASAAYDFFRRVYRDNPILDPQTVTRDNVIAGLTAGCNEINQNPDLQVPIALESALHERVTAASATLIDTTEVRDVTPNPPIVTRVDQDGVAHVNYGFKGPGKKLLVCLGTARASLRVQFTIAREVPLREPQN